MAFLGGNCCWQLLRATTRLYTAGFARAKCLKVEKLYLCIGLAGDHSLQYHPERSYAN